MRLLVVISSFALLSATAALPAYAQRGGHGGGGGSRSSGAGFRGGFSGGGSRGFSSGGFRGGVSGGTAFRGGTNFNGGFRSSGFPSRGFTSGFVNRGLRGGTYPRYSFGFGYGGGYPYYGYPYGYYGASYYDPYYYDSYYGSGYGYAPQPYYGTPAAASPVVINQNYPLEQNYQTARPEVRMAPQGLSPQESFYRAADFYLIAFTNHTIQAALSFTVEGDTIRYITREHVERTAPLSSVDVRFSEQINRDRRVEFRLP